MVSRIIKKPITVPNGVEINIVDQLITVKGAKGQLSHQLHPFVEVMHEGEALTVKPKSTANLSRSQLRKRSTVDALAGTTGALIRNCIQGVDKGFVKTLTLVGVGYRAQLQGAKLVLALGFSHPVDYQLPEGISAKVPSPTEIEIEGIDKQKVGQVAAEIRAFRPPESYKGKGVRYKDEVVQLKETKKK